MPVVPSIRTTNAAQRAIPDLIALQGSSASPLDGNSRGGKGAEALPDGVTRDERVASGTRRSSCVVDLLFDGPVRHDREDAFDRTDGERVLARHDDLYSFSDREKRVPSGGPSAAILWLVMQICPTWLATPSLATVRGLRPGPRVRQRVTGAALGSRAGGDAESYAGLPNTSVSRT